VSDTQHAAATRGADADAAALVPGASIVAPGGGRPVGRVALAAGARALAILRLAPALAAAAAAARPGGGGAGRDGFPEVQAPELRVSGAGSGSEPGSGLGPAVVPVRPEWWPAPWGHEDTGDATAEAAVG
jgi:hypothetical protein